MENNIYDLELNEGLDIVEDQLHITIVRVPGGWIYRTLINNVTNAVFVPYCSDFKPEKIDSVLGDIYFG